MLTKPVDKRYWLIVSIVLITILCACVLVQRQVSGMFVYPHAHFNPNIAPGCRQTEPLKIWQVNTNKDWAVSSSSRYCFTTRDTADQVWNWYQQAGWGYGGGKCPCISRTTYYLKWADLGFVAMEAHRTEQVVPTPLSGGNTTLIDYMVSYSLILYFR